jgi:hypothetical protein
MGDDPTGITSLVGLHKLFLFLAGLGDARLCGFVACMEIVHHREYRFSSPGLLVARGTERSDLAICRGLLEPGLVGRFKATPRLPCPLLELRRTSDGDHRSDLLHRHQQDAT